MITNKEVKEIAYSLGADLCGIASVERFKDAPTGFHPLTSEITYVANNLIELDEEQTEKVQGLIDALEDIDDVQNVYSNLG